MTERERHGVEMAKVGILMGSDSDLEIMSKAAKMLEDFGIDYEMNVISTSRAGCFCRICKNCKR